MNSANWLLTILATFFVLSLHAQFSVRIIDMDQKTPIPFAHLYFPDLNTGSTSDSAGYCTVPILHPEQIIQVSALGYKTRSFRYVQIPDDKIIMLEEAHIELEEILISSPYQKLQSEQSMNVSSIKLTSIHYKNNQSLTE